MDVGLARVSTVDQNPQLQLDALRKAGCKPVVVKHLSGVSADWDGVRGRVLRNLEADDTLTVWKLDRLGRSITDLNGVVTDLERRGVKFRSLTEHIDTSTAQGRLFFWLLAAFAEFERTLIVERTKAGKAARVAGGLHAGGPRTYGFATDRATVIEEEARVLRFVAEHVLHRDPMARVVDHLNRLQIPTKGGGRSKDGGRWHQTMLVKMLRSPVLVPEILTAEQHADLVNLFADPARKRQGRPAYHLLAGLLTCGACGTKMGVTSVKDVDGGSHLVYRCLRQGGGRPSGCGNVSIRVDTVEEFMEEAVTAFVTGPTFREALNARRAALLEGSGAVDLDALRAELADYQALPARFRTPQTEARTADLQRAIRETQVRLAAAPELGELLDLPRTRASWEAAWSSWNVAEQRRKLKLLLRSVTVKPVGRGVRFHESRLVPDWKV
jgi:DNA invertase Pin-like site-specific DNA recombinase